MSNSVKVFASTDSGAPVLSGTAGALIGVLDACLQNGYGEVTIDSLVVASDVATVTDSTGHGFTMLGAVGPVVRISGATPAGLNGDWRITVTSATQFTFTTSGITDQTASGTIVVKRAPAGFTKAFSGTNLAAYRSDDVTGTRLYLRIDDGTTTYSTVRGYEALTDINTGTGLFPAANGYLAKSSAANTTARPWKLIGDGRLFYFFSNSDGASYFDSLVFGDINSYKSGDAYHCWLCAATTSASYGNDLLKLLGAATGSVLARSYTQTGGVIGSSRYSHAISTSLGMGGSAYVNPVDNGFHAWPVEIWETTVTARGLAPGFWNPVHLTNTITDKTVVSDIPQLAGRSLWVVVVNTSTTNRAAFDITGPWR